MKLLLVNLALIAIGVNLTSTTPIVKTNESYKIHAVLVAGSNTYDNYRHQANVCHAYHILRNHGVPAENIILMMYDDVANDPENPFPGKLFNIPDGPDVYEGVVKDYTGEEVTPENFLKVLKGDKDLAAKGKKVLTSGPNDHVFIYFTDHGATGLVGFPSSTLSSHDLNEALVFMHDNNLYGKLTFYLEACESGSMLTNILPTDLNIYATTSTNPSVIIDGAVKGADCNCKVNVIDDNLKIVNGTQFNNNKYPWLVSLQVQRANGEYLHICGGSLINDQWIVTAAHCASTNLTRLRIVVGAHNLTNSGKQFKIGQFIRHPSYSTAPVVRNDIALIQLTEPIVQFTQEIQPACLTSRNIYFTNNDLYVAGWGVTDEKDHKSTEIPLELKMDHVNHLRCSLSWIGLLSYQYHICAVATSSSPCFGDSGGPLMVTNGPGTMYVVGIVSFGNSCGDSVPTVFTRVTSYLDWINETTGSGYCRIDGQDVNSLPREGQDESIEQINNQKLIN